MILVVKIADKKPKPMMSETCRLVLWLSGIGIPVFLSGMVLAFLGQTFLGLALIAGGFSALVGSTVLNANVAKAKRAAWPVVLARCTERHLQKQTFCTGEGSIADGWLWLMVCETTYEGKQYIISPKVHWNDSAQSDLPFWSEQKAEKFASQKISSNGECKLRVNPSNPLEAELL